MGDVDYAAKFRDYTEPVRHTCRAGLMRSAQDELIRRFKRELRSCVGQILGYQIKEGFGAAISGVLERVMRGDRVHNHEIQELFETNARSQAPAKPMAAGPVLIPNGKEGKT